MRTPTAIAAILLMLLSLVTGARAQVSRAPTVAVLDVLVRPKSASSPAIRQAAAEAMRDVFARKNRFTVTPREEVEKALKGSFPLPLNRREAQIIGKKLDVDRVAFGEITEIAFTEKPRRAYIKFTLSLFDVYSGELANGAVTTGYSPPSVLGSDAALLELAVKDAVKNALRPMGGGSVPTATILQVTKTDKNSVEVTLNRGTRDDFRLGQELIVVRGGERVGKIRISSISPVDSRATAIEGGEKIKPEDQAIALLDIEGYQ